MADNSQTLEILLKIAMAQNDLGKVIDGLKQTKVATEDASKAAFGFKEAFEFAGANEALRRGIDLLKQVPEQLFEGIKHGIEFTAELQNVQTAIAGILRQTQGGRLVDFAAAKQEAAGVVDFLKETANRIGAQYQDIFESYQKSAGNLFRAVGPDITKQTDLIVLLQRAMQSAGVTQTNALRDQADILAGMSSRTLGGRQLAPLLGFGHVEEMDEWVRKATAQGTLLQELRERSRGLSESIGDASQNFQADMNRIKNAIFDVEVEVAKPIMQPLQQALDRLGTTGIPNELKAGAREFGGMIVSIAQGIIEGTHDLDQFLNKYKELLALVPGAQTAIGLGGTLGGFVKQGFDSSKLEIETEEMQKQFSLLRSRVAAASTEGDKQIVFLDLQTQRTEIEQKINAEKAKGAQADQGILSVLLGMRDAARDLQINFQEIAGSAEKVKQQLDPKQRETIKQIQDQIALATAKGSGDTEALSEATAQKAYDETIKTLHERNIINADFNGQLLTAEQIADRVYHSIFDSTYQIQSQRDAQREVNDQLRFQNDLLADVKRDQQLINDNPSLSADEKQSLLGDSYRKEQQTLAQQIPILQAAIDKQKQIGGPEAQGNIEKYTEEIKKLGFETKELGFKLQSISFTGQIKTELTQWVNSFGTAAHQVAGFITGTLNTAINSTSQAISGLIFGTTTWRQAFSQAAQSIVQDLIKIALQYVVSQLVMATVRRLFGAQDAAASSALAIGAATEWAPGATLASIATYGMAAAVGSGAVLTALAVDEAAAIGMASAGSASGGGRGFEGGGFTGGSRKDRIAGPVHEMEYVFGAEAVQTLGVPFLEKLHRAAGGGQNPFAPHYQSAGFVEPMPLEPGGSHGGFWIGTSDGWIWSRSPSPSPTPVVNFPGDTIVEVPTVPHDLPLPDPATPNIGGRDINDFFPYGTTPYAGYAGAHTIDPVPWVFDPGLGWMPHASVPTALDYANDPNTPSFPVVVSGGGGRGGGIESWGSGPGGFSDISFAGMSGSGGGGSSDSWFGRLLGYSSGGPILAGSGARDDVLFRGKHGEFVLNPETVALNGLSNIAALNDRQISIPQLRAMSDSKSALTTSRSAGSPSHAPINVEVYYFNDERTAIRSFNASPEGRKYFRRNAR